MYRIHVWTHDCTATRTATAYSYARAKATAIRLCREIAPAGSYRGYGATASIRTADGEHIETVRV